MSWNRMETIPHCIWLQSSSTVWLMMNVFLDQPKSRYRLQWRLGHTQGGGGGYTGNLTDVWVAWVCLRKMEESFYLLLKEQMSRKFEQNHISSARLEDLGRLAFVRTGWPESTGAHRCKWKGQGQSARLLTRSLRGIHASDVTTWRTILRKFLTFRQHFFATSLARGGGYFVYGLLGRGICTFFFGYLSLFSAQIGENRGLLRTCGSSLSLQWLQEPFPEEIQNIWTTY